MTENAPLIGRTLAGRFRITGYIGEGGMASVYRGVQDGDSRNVAIKVMAADLVKDRKFVRRFRREAKAASMLKHPNTVEILEFGVDGDIVYLAMECIEGLDLAMVLERDRRVTEQRSASIVIQVCAALSVAHAQSIVHRDLKPDNIMIMAHPKERGAELVKVLDFGIAKILDEDEGPMPDPRAEPHSHAPSLLTRVGTIVGTPAYMSPEQGRAEKVDGRTDIYACGVLLYELVTGRTPFGGETPMQVVMRHVNEPPLPPSHWVEIHPAFEKVILKALMKWPAERQQSAEELSRELKACLGELATAKRALVPPGTRPNADAAPPTANPGIRPAAGVPAAGPVTQQAPATQQVPGAAKAAPAGSPPGSPQGGADDADDDGPSTLMIPDAAAAKLAADKKLVFPTLNIDLPDDLEKASRAGVKSPTLESQAAAKAPVARPMTGPVRPMTGPSLPSPRDPTADEDDDARTLIARPPTGGGMGLPLAQTLASEVETEAKLAQAKVAQKQREQEQAAAEAAKNAAAKPADLPRAENPSVPELTLDDPGASMARGDPPKLGAKAGEGLAPPKPAASDPGGAAGVDRGAADTSGPDREKLGLAKTLPIGQADIDVIKLAALADAAAAAAPRAPLPSLTEQPAGSLAIPPAPKKGLSVGMAMVLGALLGALVVGGIVVALVSMR